MPKLPRPVKPPVMRPAMFETRSDAWEAAGLEIKVDKNELRKARGRLVIELAALIATIIFKSWSLNKWEDAHHQIPTLTAAGKQLYRDGHRVTHMGYWLINSKAPFEIAAVFIVLGLGWMISKDLSKIAPPLFKRMDPATAGTVEFIIRLVSVIATILGAINIAGVSAQVVAVGGAFTAVVVGLAAQPVLGNLFAGMVLLSAQPFKLGQRIRLQSGTISIQDGTVSSLGLLYTTLSRGVNRIMIPNSLVLGAVVVPIREPSPVDVRVKLNQGIRPSQAQAILDTELKRDTLGAPNVVLEEIDGDDVFIRVRATPEDGDESSFLADDIMRVLANITSEHRTVAAAGNGNGNGNGHAADGDHPADGDDGDDDSGGGLRGRFRRN